MSAAIIRLPVANRRAPAPRYTAADLLEEAIDHMNPDNQPSLEEYLVSLPDQLLTVLELCMGSVDYRQQSGTDFALAMRSLAAITINVEGHLLKRISK